MIKKPADVLGGVGMRSIASFAADFNAAFSISDASEVVAMHVYGLKMHRSGAAEGTPFKFIII